jgi:hypothetical protein
MNPDGIVSLKSYLAAAAKFFPLTVNRSILLYPDNIESTLLNVKQGFRI